MSTAAAAATHEGSPGWGEPEEWELTDRDGTLRPFTGWKLATESTMQDNSRQWTVLEAFLTVENTYVLHILGCSVVYHVRGSSCNTGEPQKAAAMDADMEPCRKCRPPDYKQVNQETLFDVEVDIPTIRTAKNPAAFIKALHYRNGGGEGQLSMVAGRLLRQLRQVDPGIRAELSKPRRIH